jgi:glycosyltransferase involved in cell wall biosynthesis
MRVLQLISSAGYYGAENMLVTLAHELLLLGCDTTVGALQVAAEPEVLARAAARGLPTVSFPCSGRLDPGLPGRLARYIRTNNVGIVHTHGYKANLYGRFAGALQVATCHNWAVRTGSLGFYSVLDRFALRGFPAVAAVSDSVAGRLADFGILPPKVRVIPNGVDVERFSRAEPVLRRELNLGDRPLIGAVTRITEGKGCNILLSALVSVFNRQPDAAAVIVGAGPLDAALRRQAANLGIADRVHFTGARSDMPAIYASLNVFTLPSLDEGMPMSVLEAMSAGIPVVATSVGAIPKLLNSDSGWMVAPGSAESLAEAISNALSDRGEADRRACNARQQVETRHSARAMARAYLDLYETLKTGRSAA